MRPRRTVLWLYLASLALIALGVGLAFHDLGNSNRPHELDKSPFSAAVLALNVVVCVWLVRRLGVVLPLVRSSGRARAHALVVGTVLHVALSGLLFVAATHALVAWIRAS